MNNITLTETVTETQQLNTIVHLACMKLWSRCLQKFTFV